MKFMKLGSRPDTFYTTEAVRSVSSEVSCDVVIQVEGSRYLLHKFPLLSKCMRLQKLGSDNPEASSRIRLIQLPDFPGGVEAFELCAKFCYGITITLSAYNIVSIRCAAEYLQMTEQVEKGNLIHKIEVFFTSCILHGWKDSIVTLQSTKSFHVWCEDIGWTARCIESIVSKVLDNPTKVNISHCYSRRCRAHTTSCNGSATKGWWGEDLAELGIDLYWRTMVGIKSGGKVPADIIGEALHVYVARRKQGECDGVLLESIISLLPDEKDAVSCSFLLKLLKVANMVNASHTSKRELEKRIGIQLDEATVGDLLVPSTNGIMTYDVDVFMTILDHFMLKATSPHGRKLAQSTEDIDLELQECVLRVAKLVDGYLQEIAKDKNLALSTFIAVAEAIPEFARVDHDDLYKAIDNYLKEHQELNKSERKRLCRILDCKRLSMEACMHAAQNEMLPLRLVVQVLFFEQARATMASGKVSELPSNIKALLSSRKTSTSTSMPKASFSTNATMQTEDQWSVSGPKSPKSNHRTSRLDEDGRVIEKSSKIESVRMIPNRPKRLLRKLWPINRSSSEKN